MLAELHQGVVDADAAGHHAIERAAQALALVVEGIERQRPVAAQDVFDGLVVAVVGLHRQQRAEDFLLHHARIVRRVEQHGRRDHFHARRRRVAVGAVLHDADAALAGIVEPVAQAFGLAGIDDGGVVGIAGQVRVAPAHRGHVGPHEGVALRARHQHVVGRHAGLAAVETLAGGDAVGGLLDRVVRRHQGRRLAAQFQGHRHQVGRRGGHHRPPDRGRAGEQQVVEGQPAEGRADGGVALHHGHAFGRERLGQQARQQLRGARRVLGRLDHDVVAGGDGVGQRDQGQLDGVVPGRHDADHAQRLAADFGPRRQEGQVDAAPLGPHPAAQVAAQVADFVQGDHDVGGQGLVARTAAEIGRHGLHQFIPVPANGLAEAL